jgi:hypothetical protein
MTSSRDPGRQSLDSVGRLHYAVFEALRDLGYPGFVCQLHVWLGGRIDADVLRHALGNLGRRYPLLTARLVCEEGRKGDIYWEPRPEAACPLSVVDVPNESTVLRHAESLMTRPFDLAEGEPISFHLLRLADGRDVLVVHYDHTLMGDAQAATLLLEELDALSATPAGEVRPAEPEADEIEPYLTSHRLRTRWAKAVRLIAAVIRPRPSLKLTPEGDAAPVYDACRIAVRALDEEGSETFARRVRDACGFPNPSMALLASSFRALHRTSGSPQGRRHRIAAGVGYSLRPAAPGGALFRTFGSEMILSAELDELADRDDLTRLLVKRAREQIRRGFDLGSLHLARVGGRHLPQVRRGFKRRMKDMSFSYGYFKPVDESGRGLCGVDVERGYHLIMPWSPPGLTVSGNLCRGRLHVTVTSGVETVPAPVATDFLDALVADLVA